MSEEPFQLSPLDGAMGVEITNVNLKDKTNNQLRAGIAEALSKHGLLVIRDQDLSPDDIMAFGNWLGAPCHYPFVKGMDDHPFIVEIIKEPDETRNFGGGWHTDTSYLHEPPHVTILYAVEVPETGGGTLYADTAAAYDALSDGMKTMLSGLTGVNSAALKASGGRKNIHANLQSMGTVGLENAADVEAEHPVVRTMEDNGRKSLYLSKSHTQRFRDMTEDESAPLIGWLQAHMLRPEFITKVNWRPGTVTVWDNRRTLHSAMNDYHGHRRHMQRLTVGAQTPV